MIDVTDASFESDVLERSKRVVVIVDLWAPWCGPCRTLGPLLEDAVAATGGAVELVKINVDENPRVAATFAVQSIPAVFALEGGKVIDKFIGALPKAKVDAFVAGLVPVRTEVDDLLDAGDELSLRRALEIEPANDRVLVALARLLLDDGHSEEAAQLLAKVPETAEVRHLAALARTGFVDEIDITDIEGELRVLLDRVKLDPSARQRYVDLLEILGPGDPRTTEFRRALSSALF